MAWLYAGAGASAPIHRFIVFNFSPAGFQVEEQLQPYAVVLSEHVVHQEEAARDAAAVHPHDLAAQIADKSASSSAY